MKQKILDLDLFISYLPPNRQIIFFSVRFPFTCYDLIKNYIHDLYGIKFSEELTLKGITQVIPAKNCKQVTLKKALPIVLICTFKNNQKFFKRTLKVQI